MMLDVSAPFVPAFGGTVVVLLVSVAALLTHVDAEIANPYCPASGLLIACRARRWNQAMSADRPMAVAWPSRDDARSSHTGPSRGKTMRNYGVVATIAWGAFALSVALPGVAHAGCNLIPGTAKTFNAALGATNRPFAAPGEALEVTLRDCDPGTLADPIANHLVTVVFQPPSGPKNAVVLTSAADCSGISGTQLSACASQLGGGSVSCIAGTQAGVAFVDHDGRRFLSFRFPDTRSTCSAGGNVGKRCAQDSDCPGGSCVAGTEDETLAGPAAIAVSAANAALPCDLVSAPCTGQSGLEVCVDQLYANDGGCGTAVPLSTFSHFTALPPPNNYQAGCYALNATSSPPHFFSTFLSQTNQESPRRL